jgi:uncharacterized protein YwqG
MDSDETIRRVRAMEVPALHVVANDKPGVFSRIGGLPNLPAGLDWPKWKGVPLAFLAQIDLRELPESRPIEDLPPDGQLYFFYELEQTTWGFDPADKGSWRVLYSDDAPSQAPSTIPAGLSADGVYYERRVSFRGIPSTPNLLRLEPDYRRIPSALFERVCGLNEAPFEGRPKHQIGGYPTPFQDDSMELECQLVSNGLYCGDPSVYQDPRVAALKSGAQEWKLLLQLDTDDDTGMMWGDCGTLYFWIRASDLATREFSDVWMILQCA